MATRGEGDELHQTSDEPLTTNQGVTISDDQNSLKSGRRGPTLLEDFVLREKITHFDHERIPERIVHARGSGAHGYFECEQSMSKVTRAAFLQKAGDRVPVFARFSTVAGGAGSVDLPRDVRGFAVKFYTSEGNFDLVGNNIPVFFIQDAMKFPDLVHSVKMEPDRGFPQAGSAHDTFWDFISLMPESMHMIMWAMSDRAIPRSLRMMEGFGVHTFQLVAADGTTHFVKFHWRPVLGTQSVLWDEAVKINGADNDFHRRDLWEAIASGNFPEWSLELQIFSQEDAARFDFDVLDPTKLIPEELVPLQRVGKLVLDRNPDNFFAETEQVAFCPANIVPGIDFSDDPLLQGRLFSYLDTQLSRLGGPNFNDLPINAPKCPMHNFQRDGHMQTRVPKGRVAYEPNSLAPKGPRENPKRGFASATRLEAGSPVRARSASFSDHYTQAGGFYRSQTTVEQDHMVAALIFELSHVETEAIRDRVVSHLIHIDRELARRVGTGLGMAHLPTAAETATPPHEMAPSAALSIQKKFQPTLVGRTIGCIVGDGVDGALVAALRKAAEREKATLKIIAPTIGGVVDEADKRIKADLVINAAPSVLFDVVAVLPGGRSGDQLQADPNVVAFVRDAYQHKKVIAYSGPAISLLAAAGIGASHDRGLIAIASDSDLGELMQVAKQQRIWERP